jgi:AraC family transcriptional regulator, chemosensory pili system protein ChpD
MKFRRRTIPGIEIACLDCTGRSFARHAHDEFVIGANIVGREHIWIDGLSLEAQTDEVTLYNPGQVQAGDARGHPWVFVSLYVEPTWLQTQMHWSRQEVFEKPVVSDPCLAAALRELASLTFDVRGSNKEIAESVLCALGPMVQRHSSIGQAAKPKPLADEARRVRDRMLAESSDLPALDELAAFVGLSPVQLLRAFTRAYGLPPFRWLNGQRLLMGRKALQMGRKDLADLAIELGFADQSHFTRRFSAMFGVSPAVYARG